MSFTTKYQDYHDPALVQLWLQGEEEAFTVLYKRYLVRLLNTAFQKTQNKDTARELVQDVFMELYLHKENLDVHTSLHGYLFTILRNKIYNYYRRQLVQQQYVQSVITSSQPASKTVSQQLESKELQEAIYEQIRKLPDQCRKVFLLSREEQLSHKEIAVRLSISVNTVEQHIRKARRLLRESLGNYELSAVSVFVLSMLTREL